MKVAFVVEGALFGSAPDSSICQVFKEAHNRCKQLSHQTGVFFVRAWIAVLKLVFTDKR